MSICRVGRRLLVVRVAVALGAGVLVGLLLSRLTSESVRLMALSVVAGVFWLVVVSWAAARE